MTITAEAVTGQPFSFKRFREVLAAMGLQEGVYAAGDFKVRQRAAGANMSVEVDPGDALITIDSGTRNGASHAMSDAVENPAVSASHATLPRIDSVVLQYNDTGIPAGVGGNTPTVRVVAGVATAGATLDNRNGAPGGAGGPAMPNDALLLGDVLVPAASSSVVTANMRDRRRWARGLSQAMPVTVSDYALPTANGVPSDWTFRGEIGSGAIEVSASASLINMSAVAVDTYMVPLVDNATLADSRLQEQRIDLPATSGSVTRNGLDERFPVAAGSHLFGIGFRRGSGSGVQVWGARRAFTVREVIQPFADNT